jgi:cysteine synthase A
MPGAVREVWPAAHNVTELIGETPLIELSGSIQGSGAPIFVKDEGANPSGSVRDRTLLEILDGAAASGLLRRGDEIVMAGVTNSALSAALIAGARGYKLTVFHPEVERNPSHKLLLVCGGHIVASGADRGMDGAIEEAASYAQEASNRIYVDGRRREALVDAIDHIAHEILSALEGKPVGAFVTSVSTGSTLRHVASALRQSYPDVTVLGVAIDAPAHRAGFYTDISQAQFFSTHRYPDAGYTSMTVTELEAWHQRALVARKDGLLMGPKGASAVLGALKIRASVPPESAIVALSIDGGQRYLGFEPDELSLQLSLVRTV